TGTSSSTNAKECVFCEGKHPSIFCKNSTLKERIVKMKQKKLCPRCLEPGHKAEECWSIYNCKICQQPHSMIVCETGLQGKRRLVNQHECFFGELVGQTTEPPILVKTHVNSK